MNYWDRTLRLPSAALAVGLAVAVGCVPATGGQEIPVHSAQVEPTQTQVDSAVTPAGPDLGDPGKTERGRVTVRVGAPAYIAGGVITVTIANGLSQTIYSQDMKTDCSITILERSDGTRWEPILACLMERAPIAVAIGPGRVRTVAINPRSFNFANPRGAGMVALRPGPYRITYTYRLKPGRQGEEPYAAHSPTFWIGR